jgi:predicted metalloprotease
MRFNENVRLDPSQVEDQRGSGGGGLGGGGGLNIPIAVGGGGGGLLLVLAIVAFNLLFGGGGGASVPADSSGSGYQGVEVNGSQVAQTCRTGADANARTDCRIVGVVNSVQDYWNGELSRSGMRYSAADTVFYSGATQAGCGLAQSAEGPFYCPVDKKVYLDLSFFDELKTRFGARGGPFAQAYVVAHEYGHHVQDVLGLLQQSSGRAPTRGQEGGSVRTELQADCLAGVWANHAVQTGYVVELTDQDIADGLDAAAAVGDDRIQRQTQGRVTPETWTHGSSDQRQHWFTVGYQSGTLNNCDTSRGAV